MARAALWPVTLAALIACTAAPSWIPQTRPPQDGFCGLSDTALQRYVVAINVWGGVSASAVATVIDGRLYVLTNRHNLPPEPVLENIELRNQRYARTVATGIVAVGRDYAEAHGLGPARDYAILTVRDPSIFTPLPLHRGRYQGPVVVPSYAARLYEVGRGRQWFTDDRFDRLDFQLVKGSSGAPVITCRGEVAGLYTALLHERDWARAGFRGLSTPIARVWEALERFKTDRTHLTGMISRAG